MIPNPKYLVILLLFISFVSLKVSANDTNNKIKTKQPLIIKSKIQGSQEQPKVLYIMPWQGIKTPIVVKGKNMSITLPNFKPINPRVFKQQVKDFNEQQKINNKGQ